MDQKNSLEGPEATCNLKKQALMLMVVPLNRYKTLREQIDDHLKKEFDMHVNKLKALEFYKDPEHALEKVVLAEGANQVKEKKRGRKTKNARTRPISCSFDLPFFCYDESIGIERVSMILKRVWIIEKKTFLMF
ncbi:hypothetical protein MtrunA17_Chr7g0237181 [Medicago truncatula]|uniref:Uncharacterized protein n=1 Tax=Medicago truncatula TaxID=3880 RepID=A0A396H0H2_MEDTR|nr:hypothetical protein MtrunA17_Chr7g0237181 [Medicago truncatula]